MSSSNLDSFQTPGVDDATWLRLIEAAKTVQPRAHVPYSNFHVGAALLGESGEIYTGVNVEIASIGATVCAERSAISKAITAGEKRFVALCVITRMDPPSAPCGICRQCLAEFCEDLPVLMINPEGGRRMSSLDELLPLRFSGLDFLDT